MPKEEWGVKRVCPTTGKRFYDLNRNPIVSPYSGEVVELDTSKSRTINPDAEDAETMKLKEAAIDTEADVLDEDDVDVDLGDDVLEDDDEAEAHAEQLPVEGRVVAVLVAVRLVAARLAQCTVWCPRQSVLYVALQLPVVAVLVHLPREEL